MILISLGMALAIPPFTEGQTALPPKYVEELKAAADFHMVVAVEDVTLVGDEADADSGHLSACMLRGTVAELFRGDGSLQAGQRVDIRVDCWRHGREPEPAGPSRVYYDDPGLPYRLELWVDRGDGGLSAAYF